MLVSFTLALFAIELCLRQITNITNSLNFQEVILTSLAMILLITFSTRIVKVFLIIFLFVGLVFQSSNAIFYGGWIDPMNIYLLFENLSEVIKTIPGLSYAVIIKSTLFLGFTILLLGYTYKVASKHKGYVLANILVFVVFAFQPMRDGAVYPENVEKRFTKDTHSLIRSFHNSYGVFSAMLISDAMGNDLYPAHRLPSYAQLKQPSHDVPNIFIYYGESLSSKYMSEYGYHVETSPLLTKLTKQEGVYALSRETVAGAIATMPSTTRFFHMIEKPDARKQVSSFETSLFRYAQEAGLTTTYISTQGESYVNHIFKLAVGKYSDHYFTPPALDESLTDREEGDDNLVFKALTKIDDGTPFFTVFQPNGSHTPFNAKSPKAFKKFGSDSEIKEYENSVHYTDYILNKLYDEVTKRSGDKPWLLFITSDHGTYVDDKHITRSMSYPASYMVPGVILTNSKELYQENIEPYKDCQYLFHRNFSEMIARSLGRDVPIGKCDSGVLFSGMLTGFGAQQVTISEQNTIEIQPFGQK